MAKEKKYKDILFNGTAKELKTLFCFNENTEAEIIVKKFNIWARYFFVRFFQHQDADFHKEMDLFNARIYKGEFKSFLNVCFRGAAKTTRTKLFVAFCIANDTSHKRKYIKMLSKDTKNSTQFVTDVYNCLVSSRVSALYSEIFQKSLLKREETMSSFTTNTGIKLSAGTVGTSQRGNIQDDARPDWIIVDDFEDRNTLRSAITTQTIFNNIEEARTGLSKNGSIVYLGNYLSERGTVHRLMSKVENKLVVPIKFEGKSMWNYYSIEEINKIEKEADDFAGEYLCLPSAGHDIFFDRSSLDRMISKEPFKVVADFKMFYPYNPSHRYGLGADIGGGVGLDHSTTCIWDFSTIPARVVATYKCNTIQPDIFGDEIKNEAERYGEPIVAPENNKFDMCIGRLKQIYENLYFTEDKKIRAGLTSKVKTYGWNTNRTTKSTMLFDLKKAVEDGQAELTDEDLISELKSYTRDDLMDNDDDVRLTTRHFDLLTACFVKGTSILTDKGQRPIETISVGDKVMTRNGYKKVISTFTHKKKVITNLGLTGTADHPVFCNDNKIKDLSGVSHCDILYIWDLKAQKIERLSYTKAQPIINTKTQRYDNTESISVVEQSGRSQQPIYIGKFGLIISELSQKVLSFITKTMTLLIMTLKTLICYLPVNICRYICLNQKEKKTLENISRKIGNKSIKGYEDTIKINQFKYSSVYSAKKPLKLLQIMQNIVQGNALKELGEKKERNLSKKRFAQYVVKHLKREFLLKRDVRLNVLLCEIKNKNKKRFAQFVEKYLRQGCFGKQLAQKIVQKKEEEETQYYKEKENSQQVYNLEVEETPEYFVNNILVHNCAIGFQMRNWAEATKTNEPVYQQPAYEPPIIDN